MIHSAGPKVTKFLSIFAKSHTAQQVDRQEAICLSLLEQQDLDVSALQHSRLEFARGSRGRFIPAPRSYEWLLRNPLVRDWIDGYTSKETREKKLYQLEKVIRAARLAGPKELLDLPDREVKTLVRRVANWYLQQGKGVWAKQVTITMKGFLEAHDRPLEFKRIERIRTPPKKKISLEHVPTKTEVFTMAENAGSLRNKAIILCLFQSGVRVSCLCNWNYSLVEKQLYSEIARPVRIRVTPSLDTKLSLHGLSYYVTGLQEEAARALKEYVDFRRRLGWTPEPLDALFATDGPADDLRKISRQHVWRLVKSATRRSGINPESVWVHCLRKSFRKVLNATPQIDEDTKEALMGHKLPGSRGSYFDYHDEDEVMSKYMQADFSRTMSFSYDLPK